MHSTSNSNRMRDQVLATPDALSRVFGEVENAVRLVLPTPEIYRTRRIVLIGSGDSHFAAKGAEMAFLQHGGITVEVRPPMEAGRYHSRLSRRMDLENTLVIALSHSGRAARVREAVSLYREGGARVLAVTGSCESPLADAADRVLALPALSLPAAPGYSSYALAMLALMLLAIRMGEVRMAITMDEAQRLRREAQGHVNALRRVVAEADEASRSLATKLQETKLMEFAGAGPDFATSAYGAAKMLEAVGRHALASDLEEWAHLNYFDASPEEIATLVTIPAASRAQGRARELLAYMHKLGRMIVVIGAGEAADAARAAGHTVIPVEDRMRETWTPLLLGAPLALLAAHLAELTGAEYGRGGKGRWVDSADAGTVQQSEQWDDGE